MLGPHTHTPAPTARGWRTPTARPERGQPEKGERLTSDAPHNGERYPPGDALPPPPQRATPARKGAHCGAGAGLPRPPQPHPGHKGRGTPAVRPEGGQLGEGQRLTSDAPHNGARHLPRGRPPAKPTARNAGHKGARCGAGAGHPRPRQPHPGHTGRATPAARPRGRPAGGGTAPDTRRPSQRWKASPPEGRPPATPAARRPHRTSKPRGQCWAPTAARPRLQQVAGGPQQPPGGGQPEEGERLASDAPRNGVTHATRAARVALNAYTNTRTPARGASVRAPPPTPHRAHSTYTSQGNPHPTPCS